MLACEIELDSPRFSISEVLLEAIERDLGNNMGVLHFDSFVRENVPNGIFHVDMEQEIRKYVDAAAAPMVVIDLISLYKPLSKYDQRALALGGRFKLAYSVISEFFERIKNLGVELVFFCYGSIQEQKDEGWRALQDARYIRNLKAFDDVDAGITVEEFTELHPNMLNFRFPLTNVAKKYGSLKLASRKSLERELATYANQHRALAIISCNSDFLVFEGSWRYWSSDQLKLPSLNTMEYNRSAIVDYLGLDFKQMPLFATLGGNKIMPYNIVKILHARLGTNRDKFYNIARFVRELPIAPLQEINILHILKLITNHDEVDKQLVKQFQQSLDVYSSNTSVESVPPPRDPILSALSEDDSPFTYLIWQQKAPEVAIGHIDLRDPGSDSAQLLISLIVRMAGIVLFHKEPHRPRHCSVIIKLDHMSSHQEHCFPVQYPPDVEPPTLPELLSRDPAEHLRLQDIKFHLLAWIISDTLQPDRLQQIPHPLRSTVYTLYYLIQHNALELFEADLFLQVAYDVVYKTYDPHSLEYPSVIKSRPYRMVFLYQKVYAWTWKAFRLLGINGGNHLQDGIAFDGVLLHKRYDEWSRGMYDLDRIKHMRIYEELVDVSNNGKDNAGWYVAGKNKRRNNNKLSGK
ncbi:AAEL001015-PA [Aedes aegypti]|uniref:AAEL001015-PA n=2 Tax=Aedes aegypti TaxID=7159 RepID=A0A1S4EXI9_AEDAE|nr:uncharacterized protein LOC5579916 [Aedes aegypti]EAT47901.1 AAEL001015-PA [Aedes aegypti]